MTFLLGNLMVIGNFIVIGNGVMGKAVYTKRLGDKDNVYSLF